MHELIVVITSMIDQVEHEKLWFIHAREDKKNKGVQRAQSSIYNASTTRGLPKENGLFIKQYVLSSRYPRSR